MSDKEHDRLVTYLSESIDNLSLQINGKDKRCCYSSHAVNIAMCLFIKSKAVYILLIEQKLMSLPSPELLKNYKDIETTSWCRSKINVVHERYC